MVSLGQEVLGIVQQVRTVLDDPPGARLAAGLLVGGGEEDDVARGGLAGALQRDERHQLGDRDALRVERPASVDVAVLPHAAERRHAPGTRVGRDDVEVGEEDDRPAAPAPGEEGVEVAAVRARLDHVGRDALRPELARERVRGRRLAAGRILGVDPDDVAQHVGGLVAQPVPVRVRGLRRAAGRDDSQREQHGRCNESSSTGPSARVVHNISTGGRLAHAA